MFNYIYFDSVDISVFLLKKILILVITHFVLLMYFVSINLIRYNLMYCITLMFMTLQSYRVSIALET